MAPPLGLALALIAWLVTARKTCNGLDVTCTGSNDPMLAGNVYVVLHPGATHPFLNELCADLGLSVALLSPLVIIPVLTLAFGLQHYDWKSMMQIRQGDDHDAAATAHLDMENTPGPHVATPDTFEAEQKKLLQAGKISKSMTVVLT